MRQLPTEPGEYYWDEWQRVVTVYRRGARLYVRPFPHWQPVLISPRIAGTFTKKEDIK